MEKYIIMKKVNKFKLLAAGLLIGVAFWLLGSDFFTFMIWWEILWILGLVFMPITAQIFKGFDDNGWMYSKVIAIWFCFLAHGADCDRHFISCCRYCFFYAAA